MTPLAEAKNLDTSPERLAQLALLEIEVTRAVAKNISTSPETLEQLAQHTDTSVCRAVAQNPNLPAESLLTLAKLYPKEVLENPVLPLLCMVDASFLAKMPRTSLKALLKRSEVPHEFLIWTAENGSEDLCEALLLNANTPKRALEALQKRLPQLGEAIKKHMAFGVQSNPDQSWNQARILAELGQMQSSVKQFCTREAHRSLQEQLYYLPLAVMDSSFQSSIIWQKHTPLAILQMLSNSRSFDVQLAISQNIDATPEMLEKAFKVIAKEKISESVWCFQNLLNNPKIPESFLEQLIASMSVLSVANKIDQLKVETQTNNPRLLRMLEQHFQALQAEAFTAEFYLDYPKTTPEILEQFMQSPNENHRCKVAKHPNATIPMLETLMHDASIYVHRDILGNPKTPFHILEHFAAIDDEWGAAKAAKHPNATLELKLQIYETWVKRGTKYTLQQIAHDPDTTTELLLKLFELPEDAEFSRLQLLDHPNLPKSHFLELVEEFSKSNVENDRIKVAVQQHTPIHIQRILCHDTSASVRSWLANKTEHQEILEFLSTDTDENVKGNAKHKLNPDFHLSKEHNLELAKSNESGKRQSAARHTLHIEIIELLLGDKEKEVRECIARNTYTTTPILQKLVKDPAYEVREAILNNPNADAELVRILAQDVHPKVRFNAFRHEKAPADLQHLSPNSYELGVMDFLERFSTTTREVLATSVFLHPDCPVPTLARFVRHNSPLARLAICVHSKTPLNTLKTLTRDGDARVQATAWRVIRQRSQTTTLDPETKATNPNTAPEELRQLATQSHELARLVASNPSVSRSLLEQLLQHPDSAVQLATARNITYLSHVPNRILQNQVKDPKTPRETLIWAAEHGDENTVKYVLQNPQAEAVVLERIRQRFPHLQNQTQVHVSAGGTTQEASSYSQLLQELSQDPAVNSILERCKGFDFTDSERAEIVGLNFITIKNYNWAEVVQVSVPLAQALVFSSEEWIINYASKNKYLERPYWQHLMSMNDVEIYRNLLNSPVLPHDFIETILQQPLPKKSRFYWARNIRSISYLEQLASQCPPEEQIHFLWNPHLPSHLIEFFAAKRTSNVELLIAQHFNTPAHVLKQLVSNSNPRVREYVARNPNTESATLEQFINDPDPNVLATIADNLKLPSATLLKIAQNTSLDTTDGQMILGRVAGNPNTPQEVLDSLLENQNLYVQRGLAKNPRTPLAILERIATSSQSEVFYNLIHNPSTPLHIIQQLQNHADEKVQNMAHKYLEKSALPQDLLTRVKQGEMQVAIQSNADEAVIEACMHYLLEEMSKQKKPIFSVAAALYTRCNAEFLTKLSRKKEPLVRLAVTLHPNTPVKTLQKLLEDSDGQVRATAISRVQTEKT
jgi:hypothetical protein